MKYMLGELLLLVTKYFFINFPTFYFYVLHYRTLLNTYRFKKIQIFKKIATTAFACSALVLT